MNLMPPFGVLFKWLVLSLFISCMGGASVLPSTDEHALDNLESGWDSANAASYMSLLQTHLVVAAPDHLHAHAHTHAPVVPNTTRAAVPNESIGSSGTNTTISASLPILGWVAFLVAAGFHAWWTRDGTEAAVTRDGRWDAVKFWCTFLVVFSHTVLYWPSPDEKNLQDPQVFPLKILAHIKMPGFSFVSGMFAAGSVTIQGNEVSHTFGKLKGPLRDLILVQLTLLPVGVLAPLTWGCKPDWGSLTKAPLLDVPGAYWYLTALFAWHAVTPIISMMRQPVLVAGAASLLFRIGNEHMLDGMFFFFVFFVLGFVLGGGGKLGKERSAARMRFEQTLVDTKTRVAACFLLTVWLACWNTQMPKPLMMIFGSETALGRQVTVWSLGGLCTDAVRIGFTALVMLSFVVVVFMLPSCELLSSAGSRTLYVYTLHKPALVNNKALHALTLTLPKQWKLPVTCAISLTFTLLLGSTLMKALLHHLVQPQWLIDLCTRQHEEDADKRMVGAAGSLLPAKASEELPASAK